MDGMMVAENRKTGKCTAVVVAESESAGPRREKGSLGWF